MRLSLYSDACAFGETGGYPPGQNLLLLAQMFLGADCSFLSI